MIGKVQKFISEVTVELRKVNWPTRPELFEATWVVIVSTALLGVFIFAVDIIFSRILTLFIQ